MTVAEREYETWYGPLDFEALTLRIEQACRDEIAAGMTYGFSPDHYELFTTHQRNAAEARRIYREALETARKAAERAIVRQTRIAGERLRAAGLDDFARVIDTGETDQVMF